MGGASRAMFTFLLNLRLTKLWMSKTADALYKQASKLYHRGHQLTEEAAKQYSVADNALQAQGHHKSWVGGLSPLATSPPYFDRAVWSPGVLSSWGSRRACVCVHQPAALPDLR